MVNSFSFFTLRHQQVGLWSRKDCLPWSKFTAQNSYLLGSVDVWFADRVCADFGLKQGERRVA